MYLTYLPANQAWCFVYGDSIVPMRGTRFFESRQAAVEKAATAGLVVAKHGGVTVEQTAELATP